MRPWNGAFELLAGDAPWVRYSPAMRFDPTEVGDSLREVIARVAVALMQGDVDEAWAAVASHEATEACSAWDRLRGRYAASDEDLARDRRELLAMLSEGPSEGTAR